MAVMTRERSEHPTPTGHERRRDVRPWAAALSGFVAAGVALAVGEFAAALFGTGPTLVTAVGTQFIDRFAASLKDIAVALFGTNDKAALIVGIVVISLWLGALLGRASVRRRWIGVAGFVAFGVVGLLSYLGDPQGDTATGVVAAALAAIAGIATLFGLLRVAPTRISAAAEDASSPPLATTDGSTRRTFVASAGVLGAGAIGTAFVSRRLGASDVVATARRDTVLPESASGTTLPPTGTGAPSIDGLSPYVTPTADFYRIDTALSTPQVDVGSWEVGITGMVDRPFRLTYDELLGLDSVEEVVTLSCVSNEVGGNLVGNAVWQGVPLAALLERAGVQTGASQIVGRSVDGFTAGFPTEVGLDGRTALVAYAMNGEPLPARHGFPARLVIAGLYGYVSATKWLQEIELTTWEGFDGYWVPRGWSKEGPIKPQSRIDVPRSGANLAAGRQPVAGVAWSPVEGVAAVEVQVDDGEWQQATLGDAASGNTWVQWWLDWDAVPGEHRIQVRATTNTGVTQTEERTPPAPNGATGWHRRTVNVS